MPASHIARYEQAARSSPVGFNEHVRRITGHDSKTVTAMLNAWQRLETGGALTKSHVAMLQQAHPDVAAAVPRLAAQINGLPPRVRGDAFLAAISGDRAVLEGRYADADAFNKVKAFANDWQRESIAAQINDRRESNLDPDIAARRIEKPPADPLSARACIERAIHGDHGKLVRGIAEGVKAGDPTSLSILRGNLADRAEDAIERLRPEAQDGMSLRDTVAAAASLSECREIAEDQGFVEEERA
jgi:hypothetical protein